MQAKYKSSSILILNYITRVFPLVRKELKAISKSAEMAEDLTLKREALSSIRHKSFHCQGGSVYALYPGADLTSTVKFIVSFQTISDYLDNLCDRSGVTDEKAFRQLHLSMIDAVDLGKNPSADYYSLYPYKEDGGYLPMLVENCRKQIASLPSYEKIISPMKKYIGLYSDLQSFKHSSISLREPKLRYWANSYSPHYPLSEWEFSAAAGSTLCIFMLFAAAFNPDLTPNEIREIENAYFPWVNGLHILLDYFIDYNEDMATCDLNFTYYYSNLKECENRLMHFLAESLERCGHLKHPVFHITVVKGLLALYLSDRKALTGINRVAGTNLSRGGEKDTLLYLNLCKLLRNVGVI